MPDILFTVNYEVKQKRKFSDFLTLFASKIERELINLKIETYWKIEEQFQAQFLIKSEFKENDERVYELLLLANKLSDNTASGTWSFIGPFQDDQHLHFECIFSNSNSSQPLKWAHLQLNNE